MRTISLACLLAACAPGNTTDGASTLSQLQPELCADGLDNDGNGAIDCADNACDGSCPEICDDTRDNDGDARIDCEDIDCTGSCPESCDNGVDDDGDGATDCSDTECNDPSCDELCTDARDNDADGATDCDDADCDGLCPEACDDFRDNDNDGFVDCDDPECEIECVEDCVNGVDDDADSLVDCVDPECSGQCDFDLDGFLNADHGGDDCDDSDPAINPDATEVCSGADDDCDGLVDEDDPSLDPASQSQWYADADGDTFGDRNDGGTWACSGLPNEVANDSDCNDANASINPLAAEICDGIDNDCDNLRDDADPSVDLASAGIWYDDADGDTFGDPLTALASCNPPPGWVSNGDDCDDNDPLLLSLSDWLPDLDGDGYGLGAPYGVPSCASPPGSWASAALPEDCDDGNASVNPGAVEVCSGIDEDCDLLVDDDDASVNPSSLIGWYPDADDDGYGATFGRVDACESPANFTPNDDDCNDSDGDIHPAALEVCNGFDDDCDNLRDDADPSVDLSTATTWYVDADGDGFGQPGAGFFACAPPPGTADNDDDCDDTDPLIFAPGDWVPDLDSDGYGIGDLYGVVSCYPPDVGWVSEYLPDDCNDGDFGIHPEAPEVCEDGVDQDCDLVDKSCATELFTVRTSDGMVQIYDALAGTFKDVGGLGVGFDFGDLAWDGTHGILYMIDGRSAESLYTVNPATGKASLVGLHGVTDLFGLAWDPDLGVLWASGESPSGFYELNTLTGKESLIGDPGVPLDGLTYDTDLHEIVGLGAGTGDVYTIDPLTGKGTLLYDGPWINNCGFAYDPNTQDYYAIDWSGNVVRYDRDPVFGWSNTVVTSSGISHDGFTYVP